MITNFLSGIGFKVAATVIGGLILAGGVWFLYSTYKTLEDEKIALYTQVSTLQLSHDIQEQKIDNQKAHISRLIDSYERVWVERDAARSESVATREQLAKYEGRLPNATIQKPSLVERLANRASCGVMWEFHQASLSRDTSNNGAAGVANLSPSDTNRCANFLKVLTPEITRGLNLSVDAGEIEPYVYFSMSSSSYLTFSRWLQDVLRFIKEQQAIIEAYEEFTTPDHPG